MTEATVPSVYLDANILVYLVEGYASHEATLGCLLAALESGRVKFLTSELSLAEVLVLPLGRKRHDLVNRYEQLLAPGSGIALAAVDAAALRRSAEFRAANGGSLLDMIHVATAVRSGCSVFLSEDARIKVVEPLERITLSEFAGRFAP